MQTRERLILAALDLFSEKGYHATNSKEIAARSGAAIGSFYAYFNDKKELFIEAYRYYAALIEKELYINTDRSAGDDSPVRWKNLWSGVSSCGSNRERIKILITRLVKAHEYYPGFIREITVMRLVDPEIRKIIDDHEKGDICDLIDLLKSMGASLRINDIDIAANIIFRALEVVIHEVRSIPGIPDSGERIINEITDLVCRYLFDE